MAVLGYLPKFKNCIGLAFGAHFLNDYSIKMFFIVFVFVFVFVVWLTDERPGTLSEIFTIPNLRYATRRIWTYAEPESRPRWMKLCCSNNNYTTAPQVLYIWFHCHTFFPSQDIKQNVLLSAYLDKWWHHKFWDLSSIIL